MLMSEISQIDDSSYNFKKLDRKDQIKYIGYRRKKIKQETIF